MAPDRPWILIVNDDTPFMDDLVHQAETGPIHVDWVKTLQEAEGKLSAQPYSVVVFKSPLQDEVILNSIPRCMELASSAGFIVCSEEGPGEVAEQLVAQGIHEYLPYPLPIPDLVSIMTQLFYGLHRRKEEAGAVLLEPDWARSFVGESPKIRECLEVAVQASRVGVNVLVTGETGTGKELLSELIHRKSERGGENFIVVDCAALPEHLVESTLYGHEKGAFTSAERDRRGLVQEASGGTLFLDELGELPLEVQKRFLRVLDTKTFRKVGGQRELTSDFRLICATNRDLDDMVSQGRFREDLLHRVRTLQIDLPPLRSRREDIEPLALSHLEEFCRDVGQPLKRMSPRFTSALKEYSWPGNVRELFNSIERSVAAAGETAVLHRFHLPVEIRADLARKTAAGSASKNDSLTGGSTGEQPHPFPSMAQFRQEAVSEAEGDYLRQLISRCGGDVDVAVQLSGLSRSRLYALLKEHNLSLKK